MSVIKKSLALAAVSLGCVVGSAHAQEIMTVNVPFPFIVGHEKFPAGQYEVRSVDDSESSVSLVGMNNGAATFMLTIPVTGRDPAGDQPALVFTPYEQGYRLSQIWEYGTQGRELPGRSVAPTIGRLDTPEGRSAAGEHVLAARWR